MHSRIEQTIDLSLHSKDTVAKSLRYLAAVISSIIVARAFDASAADTRFVLCISKSSHKIAARSSCTPSETRLQTDDQLRGQTGADGALRIYGDGSSGPLDITGNTDWTTNPPASSVNYYTDVTIAAGATLTVPSSYVFRCTGKFDVLGSLIVRPSPSFAAGSINQGGGNPGISARAPEIQKPIENFTGVIPGAGGGRGLQNRAAAAALRPGLVYGGASSTGATPFGSTGGGGVLFVLAKAAITVHPGGSIAADGAAGMVGTGGGGGGVIVLASPTATNNFGTISARGGNGSPATESARHGPEDFYTDTGAGGGGGGGVLHFISPIIVAGVTSVTGGTAGAGDTQGSADLILVTGAGGGGSYGDGGQSGGMMVSVASTGLTLGARQAYTGVAGTDGIVIETPVDPTFTF